MTEPAAGWYPDPGGSTKLRYWNGRAWTQHVSPPDVPPEPAGLPDPDIPASTPSAPASTASAPASTASAPASTPSAPVTLPADAPPLAPPIVAPPPWQPGQPATPAVERLGPDGQVLSGWWRRFFGYLIDSLIISVIAAIVVWIIASLTGGFGDVINTELWNEWLTRIEQNPNYQPSQAELQQIIGPGFLAFVGWFSLVTIALGLLNGVLLVAISGQTVADRLVGTRKVLAGRRVPGFGPALLRWLIPGVLNMLQVLPLIGFLALFGWILDYLWPLWDPQRQALHDKAAKTYVERSALAGPVNP